MAYKSILVALLGLSLGGCAVYGGGYGHRGYDRSYTTVYYRAPSYPVYVVPRYERHDKHYRYYAPVPLSPRYQPERHSGHRDYRFAQPQARWDDRRGRTNDGWRQHQQHSQGRHDDRRRGWEQRN